MEISGTICGLICLIALTTAALARDDRAAIAASSPKDPVCGFAGKSYYFEEDPAREGLAVSMAIQGEVLIGKPVRLRFYISREPGALAVDNLQLEHEKLIHVIGVRDDLGEFFHIHPVRIGPGIWEVSRTFTNGGNYKIWSDTRYQDISYAIGHPVISIPGNLVKSARGEDRPDYEVRAGHQITFKHTEPLLAGGSASLQFLIRDAAGKEILTENFLGAPMHLVIVKDDLTVYRHAHPDHQESPQPLISFTQIFPSEGRYKLFVQFRPKGTTLPAEDAILVEFTVNVTKGGHSNVTEAQKTR